MVNGWIELSECEIAELDEKFDLDLQVERKTTYNFDTNELIWFDQNDCGHITRTSSEVKNFILNQFYDSEV